MANWLAMELFRQFLSAITITVFVSFIISSMLRKYRNQAQKKQAPESGGAWPIIGHLPLLRASRLPHKVLATMADTYGPIFTIRLGVKRALVVSSPELARECLLINDRAVSGRPKTVATEVSCYNNAIFGFCPYGSYWRYIRRIVMLELLSTHRLNLLSHVWKSEVKMFVNGLYKLWGTNKTQGDVVLVDLQRRFGDLTSNIIVKIISSKQFTMDSEEGEEFCEAMMEFFENMGTFAIGDALPFLRWLDIGGQEKAMKSNFKKIDHILQRWLDEHQHERPKVDQDFMDVMRSVLDCEATKDCNYDADTINKATCLMIIAGATDSTMVTLTWAISLLLNNPHVLKKAQDELGAQVSKDRQIDESDISRLVYLQAIVKETLRLYPTGPLMGPREFIEDCTIGGYYVKAGTRLIVNLHKISRDPLIWENPLEFQPERFLTTHKDVNFRGKHFEFIPFGAGRRMCPGISFGLEVVHLALANFLHAFEFSTPLRPYFFHR